MRSQAVAVVAFLAICIGSCSSKSVITSMRLEDDAPDQWNNTLMYQIEVGSFSDSNGDGMGDLQGIIDKQSYLSDLGVNAIILSPLFDETDWSNINSSLGDEKTLQDLISKFQSNDIKVILDLELTCTSQNHQWIKANPDYYIQHKASSSECADFSNWLAPNGSNAWVANPSDSSMCNLQFFDGPELNYNNNSLVNAVQTILKNWTDNYKFDGFRIRHASYFIENIDDVSLNEIEIADCTDSNQYNCYDHSNTTNTDGTFNLVQGLVKTLNRTVLVEPYFQFNYDLTSKMAGVEIATPVLTNFTMATNTDIMRSVLSDWMKTNVTNFWMFGNRDVSRASTRMGEDQLDSANIISMLLPGTLLVYYGEELGMSDVDGLSAPLAQRAAYQWNCDINGGFSNSTTPLAPVNPDYCRLNADRESTESPSYLSIFKNLVDLRKTVKDYNFEIFSDNVNNLTLAFSRSKGDDKYIVLVNTDNYSETYNLTQFFNLNGDESLGVHASSWNSEYQEKTDVNMTGFTMRPWSAVILHSGSSIAQFSMFLILLGLAVLRLQ